MTQPIICNSDAKQPVFPLACPDGYWAVPAADLSEITKPDRDHAYILPDNSVWILNHDGTGMSQLNGGSSDSGQPTLIKNNDGYIKISGSGTYKVQADLDTQALKSDLGIEELTKNLATHINDSSVHVSKEEKDKWNGKQNLLSAGEYISISADKISAEGLTHNIPIVRSIFLDEAQKMVIELEGNTIERFEVTHENESSIGSYNTEKKITSYTVSLKGMSTIIISAKDTATVLWQYNLAADSPDWDNEEPLTPGYIQNKPSFKTVNGQDIIGNGNIALSGSTSKTVIVNTVDVGEESVYSITIDEVIFSLEKQTNGQWGVYLTNDGIEEITAAYYYNHFYDYATHEQTGGNSKSSPILLKTGEKSKALDVDSIYLGYGSVMLGTYTHLITIIRNNNQTLYEMTSTINRSAGTGLIAYIEKII